MVFILTNVTNLKVVSSGHLYDTTADHGSELAPVLESRGSGYSGNTGIMTP